MTTSSVYSDEIINNSALPYGVHISDEINATKVPPPRTKFSPMRRNMLLDWLVGLKCYYRIQAVPAVKFTGHGNKNDVPALVSSQTIFHSPPDDFTINASTAVGTPVGEADSDYRRKLRTPSSSSREPPDITENLKDQSRTEVVDLEKNQPQPQSATPPRKVPEGYREYDDPNIVSWDGPDDPEHPHNWKRSKKVGVCISIAFITFLTPLGSSMFAPAVPQVMKEFNSTNQELAAFIVSVYLLGFSFGPLIIAPLSELYGRVYFYHVCNILFVAFNIGCAKANSIETLIVFRLLAGAAGSAPLAIGAGSLSDMIGPENRGAAMAAWALGPLLGPVIGPVGGSYLMAAKGWRWTFWLISMTAGVMTINTYFWLTESYHPVLLARKTKRLIKETGNTNLRSALDQQKEPKQLILQAIVRPCKMLVSPIILLLSIYVAVVYGYLYLMFTTLAPVFVKNYGFSESNAGLAFLGIGVGSIFGLAILWFGSDRLLKRLSHKAGGVLKPEFRLPPLIPGSFFIPIGLFWYGWSVEYRLHYMMPIIGTLWVGIGMLIAFMTVSTYLVDAYTRYSASAMAANTVLRSLVGALLPLCGLRMFNNLGLGWGSSLLGFISLSMVPFPIVFYLYGERIRTSKKFAMSF
ncbi:hypothetical protein FQN57_003694 [Myotisia sp. PD_48]|nr:hypothetical protein FQN57_003694 [Myotisia sp. PD_48]